MKKLSTSEAAAYLGLSLGSLRNIRSSGLGPKSCGEVKGARGTPLLFRVSDLDLWQAGRRLIKALERFQWRTLPLDSLEQAAAAAGIDCGDMGWLRDGDHGDHPDRPEAGS